jgi:calcium-dependent protein kinase
MMNYVTIKELGVGGMAKVNLIEDKTSNIQYACKIIPKRLDPSRFSEKMCDTHSRDVRNEINIMKKLQNEKHVIKIKDTFEDENNYYMVMENCKGGSVYDFFVNSANFTENDVRKIIKAALRTVGTIHIHDIVHNDIKPENFLFADASDITTMKIIDFGSATEVVNGKHAAPLFATPWYMAPETMRSETSKKSDVWSVGIMTHYLLTGKFPFNDRNNPFKPSVYKIWHSILHDNLDFKRKCWYDISDKAKDFVAALLEKDENKRLTVYEALVHPWITGKDVPVATNIGVWVTEHMTKYNRQNIVMRTILEDFVDVLISKYNNKYIELPASPDNSLYDINRVLVNMNSQRVAFLLNVIRDKGIKITDKISKRDLILALQRLNTDINDIDDVIKLFHKDDIDLKTVVSSQMDWNILISDEAKFEEFITEVFEEMDRDGDGLIRERSFHGKPISILFRSKSMLTFEEFFERVHTFVDDNKEQPPLLERQLRGSTSFQDLINNTRKNDSGKNMASTI